MSCLARPWAPLHLRRFSPAILFGLAACGGSAPKPSPSSDSTTTAAARPAALSRALRMSGWYTADQATQGKALYATSCAMCHGPDLKGRAGPALAGPNFFAEWGGKPLSALYGFEHTSMPLTAPGSLTQPQYVAITAYILDQNGFVPGSTALTAGSDLSRIVSPSGGNRDLQRAAHALSPLPPVPRGKALPAQPPSSSKPTQDELLAADTSTTMWLTANKGYLGHRYSPITDVTPDNASALRPVCQYMTGEQGTFESAPVEYDGVLYFTTTNGTYAIDASTCHEVWSATYSPPGATYNNTNRGLAIGQGRVFRGTIDGHLLAYDARTGVLLWDRDVTQGAKGKFIAAAPLVYEKMLLVGTAGGDLATVGSLQVLSVDDGSPLWAFNTIPQPGATGGDSWKNAATRPYGGGAVWTSMSLDVASGTLIFPVGNPAPDFNAAVRPGDNLFTVSVVALDAKQGTLKWYFQGLAADDHDWDMSTVALVESKSGTQYVAASGKHGLLYLLDRATGKKVWETPITTRENADAPITAAGLHYCPGSVGGVEWNGPAWYPRDGVVFVNSVDWCLNAILGPVPTPQPGLAYTGLANGYGKMDPVDRAKGWINAVDIATGQLKWRKHMDAPMIAGLAPTAGGVVFTGDVTGNFLALESATGRELYRYYTGGSMGGGVITYRLHGRQRIAVATGNSSRTWNATGSPTIVVFGL